MYQLITLVALWMDNMWGGIICGLLYPMARWIVSMLTSRARSDMITSRLDDWLLWRFRDRDEMGVWMLRTSDMELERLATLPDDSWLPDNKKGGQLLDIP